MWYFARSIDASVLVNGVDTRLKEILQAIAAEFRCELMQLEVMPDHVHVVCEVDPQFGVHKLVKHMKGRSSRLLRQEFPHLKSRLPTLVDTFVFRRFGGRRSVCLSSSSTLKIRRRSECR